MNTNLPENALLGTNPSEMKLRFLNSFKDSFSGVDMGDLTPFQAEVWERELQAIEKIEALTTRAREQAMNLINNHGVGKDTGGVAYMPTYALKEGEAFEGIEALTGAERKKAEELLKKYSIASRVLDIIRSERVSIE
jgi:hypothetical protein